MAATYLMSMPLHAITEVYGEGGLRARFAQEVEALSEPGRGRVLAALSLAEELHRDDRRVREPYLNHLLRVTIRILCYYGIDDPEVLAAALLHDSVEDHPEELAGQAARTLDLDGVRRAALGVLADRFGARVAGLVASVTNPVYDPARDVHEQYREHVLASLDRDPWARVIKVSDFTDNGVGVIHTVGPKVGTSAAKYRPLVLPLRELVARSDTPLSIAAKAHIFDQLDLAEERFAAILDR